MFRRVSPDPQPGRGMGRRPGWPGRYSFWAFRGVTWIEFLASALRASRPE